MASPERKHTGLRVALATALGFSGAAGAVLAGKAILEGTSRQPVSASKNQEGGIMPSAKTFNELVTQTPFPITPTVTETPIATSTSTVTNTTEPTASNTPTVTVTRTVTASVTPTETSKPLEKNPLPSYGVFQGELLNSQGAKEGMLVIASVPQQTGPEQLAVFIIKDIKAGGGYSSVVFPANISAVQGDNFETINPDIPPRVMKAGTYTIVGTFNRSSNQLNGTITKWSSLSGTREQVEVLQFKTGSMGSGKDKVTQAVKQMKTSTGKYGNDWTQVRIEEFMDKPYIKLP